MLIIDIVYCGVRTKEHLAGVRFNEQHLGVCRLLVALPCNESWRLFLYSGTERNEGGEHPEGVLWCKVFIYISLYIYIHI